MLSLWLHPDKQHSDAIKYFAFQQVPAFGGGGQVPQLLKLKGKKNGTWGPYTTLRYQDILRKAQKQPKGDV